EARISGTLPISLPPYHVEGEGLVREQVAEPLRDGGGDSLDETGFVAGGDEPRTEAPPDPPLTSMTVSRAEALPSDAAMSAAVLARLDSAILEAVVDSATPGAALAVGRGDRLVRLRGYGRIDGAPDAPPATPTTLYDLASLTKVVATTTAVMRLVDEGRLSLDDRVVEHLPWWAGGDPRKADVTLRQLLLHRAGLPEYEPLYTEARGHADYERAIGAMELELEPGTRSRYSDLGMMTLGFIVEEVTGLPLGRHVDETVWTPLGMEDTGFLPEEWLLPRIAPTEVDTILRNSHLRGVVHDENAWALGGRAGHAGVFSTAADLAVYARMMLAGGELEPCLRPLAESGTSAGTVACTVPWADGGRVLSEEVVAEFTRRWDDGSSRALGWDTPSGRSSAGDFFTADAFGHTGFTGTSIWIDPELDLFVVLLTNRVNPTRENQKHLELRRTVHDLAARAITDRTVEPRE
ncbi:MAG: serine hydrolase domain-containing protein, partial [Longimicrobiales bacterium]|nr:serine hydrolase domain-containing protein [Longimicrobiales bacterium]